MTTPNREENENGSPNDWTFLFRQVFSCSAVVLNYFLHGVYIGSSTVIVAQIRREANSTAAVSNETASWLSSISSYSAVPWGVIIPLLAYRYGRKILLLLVSLNVLLGNIVFYLSTNMIELIVSQALQGILLASASTATIMVTSEYVSPKYRGVLMTAKSATMFWGVWVSNAIGTYFHWRVISIVVFVCCVYYISVLFCRESPYWLATKGRFDECARIHRWLKGTGRDSEEELRQLISTQRTHLNTKTNTGGRNYFKIFPVMRCKFFYKSLAYSSLPICLYVFSGKLAYTVYAIDLIKEMTSSEKLAYESMLILDGVTVAGMYIGSVLAKYVTRRTQLISFTCIAAFFLYVLSGYIYLVNLNLLLKNNYFSIFLLTGFSVSISCGPIIMTNCYVSEMSPFRYRSYFVCYISMLTSIIFATMIKIAPLIFEIFNIHGAFLFYALVITILMILSYLYLPETKDKTIMEIQDLISGETVNIVKTELLPLTK